MAIMTGPYDAPHGIVTITMERYEAEAIARIITAANLHGSGIDEDALDVLRVLTPLAA